MFDGRLTNRVTPPLMGCLGGARAEKLYTGVHGGITGAHGGILIALLRCAPSVTCRPRGWSGDEGAI